MALTQEKAERIAQEYAKIDYKEKVAPLITVGYSPNYARSGAGLKLYENVRVKAAIQRIKANVAAKTGVSVEWVVNNLKTVAERCMKKPYDNPGANKALELIGKHVNAFDADNKSKAPIIRKYDINELKVLILDADSRDKRILDAGTGIAE